MERTVEGEVTEITPEGVYVKEGYGQWFVPKESLEAGGITDVKVGDKLSFKVERGLCGMGRLKEIAKVAVLNP